MFLFTPSIQGSDSSMDWRLIQIGPTTKERLALRVAQGYASPHHTW